MARQFSSHYRMLASAYPTIQFDNSKFNTKYSMFLSLDLFLFFIPFDIVLYLLFLFINVFSKRDIGNSAQITKYISTT